MVSFVWLPQALFSEFQNFVHNYRNSICQSIHDLGNVNECLPELKRKLREKDEKIMQLEGEVAKWEQRYLEESELRQAAIDAASIPK